MGIGDWGLGIGDWGLGDGNKNRQLENADAVLNSHGKKGHTNHALYYNFHH